MKNIKKELKTRLREALQNMAASRGVEAEVPEDSLVLEKPPRLELGDIAVPLFPFAKLFKSSPPKIAEELAGRLAEDAGPGRLSCATAGPYLNIRLDREEVTQKTLSRLQEEGESYGASKILSGEKIMVEFSSPNTN
ncbi:MAG: arginine--tRNA ligase, partial [Spirochaetales bacterium]|nr:arginine--tRNA ligase [Spirochaetales bacterium]